VVELRAELARKIAAHVRAPGEQTTAILALTLYRLTAPTACYAVEYETGLAVIVSLPCSESLLRIQSLEETPDMTKRPICLSMKLA
jgi:hypothetical protein